MEYLLSGIEPPHVILTLAPESKSLDIYEGARFVNVTRIFCCIICSFFSFSFLVVFINEKQLTAENK